ncbi:MAG: nuclear transport factor 2 family protein [Streptomyces sp.]|nr:nuclear transport factor 2 family protein [Streptomyces sp.]
MTGSTDHYEISALVSRYFRALDERRFEGRWARDCLTDDVRLVAPIGTAQGGQATRLTAQSLEKFARTQHMATDILIEVEPGARQGSASWNALMTHVHHDETLRRHGPGASPLLVVGGRYDAELLRTEDGWRIRGLTVQVIWTTGEPPDAPADPVGTPER